MEKVRHVFLKTFWDVYDLSPRLFIITLFWLAAGFPWLAGAAFLYAAFPGTGALAVLPFLLLNPASWAAYRSVHAVLYHDTVPPFAAFWRTWPQGALKSQMLLAVYLLPVLVLHAQWRFVTGALPWYLAAAVLVQLALYLCMLGVLPLLAPMEMFRPRTARELAVQAVLILVSHTGICLGAAAVTAVLGFAVVRFGVMALVFVPITVVLGMNVLYYVYMKHGSMTPQPYVHRSFRELLKPFTGKVSGE